MKFWCLMVGMNSFKSSRLTTFEVDASRSVTCPTQVLPKIYLESAPLVRNSAPASDLSNKAGLG